MKTEEAIKELELLKSIIAQDGTDWVDERDIPVLDMAIDELKNSQWIPFKDRELEDDEKEYYPNQYRILDCPLPEDGQRILITVKYKGREAVQLDEFYTDDGAYLDSGYDLVTEAIAWKPLPKEYRGDQ